MSSAEHWRLKQERYSLVGEICDNCDEKIFPPRDICPSCLVEAKEPYRFSGKGEIYSFTTVHQAPQGHEENAPYTLALVRLNEGPMVSAQMTDLGDEDVFIGMPVEMVTRRLKTEGDRGVIVYGYKFRPLLIKKP